MTALPPRLSPLLPDILPATSSWYPAVAVVPIPTFPSAPKWAITELYVGSALDVGGADTIVNPSSPVEDCIPIKIWADCGPSNIIPLELPLSRLLPILFSILVSAESQVNSLER